MAAELLTCSSAHEETQRVAATAAEETWGSHRFALAATDPPSVAAGPHSVASPLCAPALPRRPLGSCWPAAQTPHYLHSVPTHRR